MAKLLMMEYEDYDEHSDLWLSKVLEYIENRKNNSDGLNVPHLRKSLSKVYPLFIVIYGCLILFGIACNVALLGVAIKVDKRQKDPTVCYLVNIGIAGVIQCTIVLPISLAVLLIQNWVFGAFLCYFLPMLQDIPINVIMLTFVAIAWDRYRFIHCPERKRMPTYVVSFVIWITSMCVVMPYAAYMAYFPLQVYFGNQLAGVGLCTFHSSHNIEYYLRCLFFLMYVIPLFLVLYCYIKITANIKAREAPITASLFDSPMEETFADIERSPPRLETNIHLELVPGHRHIWRVKSKERNEETEHDINKEKRTQKYLISMVVSFALCMFPLSILKLVNQMVVETFSNTGHFDITFIVFVWIAFLPNVFVPFLFFIWRLSRPTKERLSDYLRINYRPHTASTLTASQEVEDFSAGIEGDGSSCSRISICDTVVQR
ncbi:prolactin-releasing peptide receptor-like [Artemia franciscana]|uniref:G-protein coupled receptors family 1 profile domain-containing protein n=1 Tax=Artemia franciscana TaxID=6661 RepID=A0AA88HZK1_ARTSF|nr:hypothetical protein QYM36_011535 [Artemia franciscana]KAK2712867.1 hypothetical protein QYM36_011535 [Artemia franciscana]KAK2712868.1 hypothetical protein QYM36_011535 [Artemia franciscana]